MRLIYLYSMLCFLIPNSIWLLINKKKMQGKQYSIRHIVWSYIFMLYCYLAVQDAAGIGTIWDLIAYGKLDDTINVIPFSSEGIMTYVLNIIMFMPLGFLLPLIWKNFRNAWKVIFMGFGLSLGIEFLQLFSLRATDIDDLIMNTIGTVLGYLIWALFHKLVPKSGENAVAVSSREPIIYITLETLGIVFLYNWRMFY